LYNSLLVQGENQETLTIPSNADSEKLIEAVRVPWTLSTLWRRVHPWPKHILVPIPWSSGLRSSRARAGRRPEDLAAEFELSNQTIRNWIRQADLDAGKRTDGLTREERAELFMLRKKVKQLTIEREILSKAAAWFARETETLPKRSSDS
jgi:transposase